MLTKLLDRLQGIQSGYDKDMESRSVILQANGMIHKLKDELKNDGLVHRVPWQCYDAIGTRDQPTPCLLGGLTRQPAR